MTFLYSSLSGTHPSERLRKLAIDTHTAKIAKRDAESVVVDTVRC